MFGGIECQYASFKRHAGSSVPTFYTLPVLRVFKNYCPFVEEQYYIHILSSGFMQILLITYFYADLIILYSTL